MLCFWANVTNNAIVQELYRCIMRFSTPDHTLEPILRSRGVSARGTSVLYVCSSSGARRWILVISGAGRRCTRHHASRFGHLEVSRLLVDHGANVNATHQNHQTPLDLSARIDTGSGHLGIVKLLLERGADIDTLNDEGETPYQLSLQRGHRRVENLLREHRADRERFDEILS